MSEADEIKMLKELLEQSQADAKIWKVLYENLKQDFEDYKKGKDINYLDNNHHKILVENSIGQIIDKPEDCWFDQIEVKIIINDTIYTNVTSDDFITLQEIANIFPKNSCITVIAESPLSGAVYRYNNYGKNEWQLIGIMLGYA